MVLIELEGRKETRLLLKRTPTGEQGNLLSMRGSHRGTARDCRLDIMPIQIIFLITSKGGLGVGEDWESGERGEQHCIYNRSEDHIVPLDQP